MDWRRVPPQGRRRFEGDVFKRTSELPSGHGSPLMKEFLQKMQEKGRRGG
jgi:hypothetical protein